MKLWLRSFCLIVFVLSISVISAAQQRVDGTSDLKKSESARIVFTKLFNSEKDAQSFVTSLYLYRLNSPWEYETILALAQRLVVARYKPDDTLMLLKACGDAAVGVNAEADDEDFAQLVGMMYDLRGEQDDVYLNLERLERAGAPAYTILGEATGMSREKVEKLASQRRLKATVAYQILCEGFEVHFSGLAQKIAKQREKQ